MSVIIFIIILGVLIFVHELGHFTVAKKSGIRVDEFAVGFPPRLFSFFRNGTRYALNLIPFGGYVKIFGENPDEESSDPNAKDSFVNKSRWIQAAVLIAGVTFNVIFAWILISFSLMSGFPTVISQENSDKVIDSRVVITSVENDSPAFRSGIQSGDVIKKIVSDSNQTKDEVNVDDVRGVIGDSKGQIKVTLERKGEVVNLDVTPISGIIEGKPAIGITMDTIGTMKLNPILAFVEGFKMTAQILKEITIGLFIFLGQAFTAKADLDQVAGPVGIVGLVDNASNFGFVYLLGFTAFISLNLAVLNLLPFPALDGGRLLFVIIEGITKKKIKSSILNTVNAIGFLILIIFMIVITISDVIKLFL